MPDPFKKKLVRNEKRRMYLYIYIYRERADVKGKHCEGNYMKVNYPTIISGSSQTFTHTFIHLSVLYSSLFFVSRYTFLICKNHLLLRLINSWHTKRGAAPPPQPSQFCCPFHGLYSTIKFLKHAIWFTWPDSEIFKNILVYFFQENLIDNCDLLHQGG